MAEMNLPEGWVIASYSDLYVSASNGLSGTQTKDKNGIAVSRIETIANKFIDYDRVGYIENYDNDKIEKYSLQKGDILFSHINSPSHLGKTAIFDGKKPLYHGINLLRIVIDRRVILPEVFNYHCRYLRALGVFSLNAQHAVNQSSLNQKKLGAFTCHLPPLAEQKVIANQLDNLLAQVERTKARLERIPTLMKQFRQSVLADAVSGKLTEGWRERGGYDEKGYPVTWQNLGLSEVGELSRGKSKHRPRNDPKLFGSEYPFIQTGEIANSNGFIANASKCYSEFGLSQSKLFPKETLCITIAANIADTAILAIDACFPDSVVGFTSNKEKCSVLFVKYLIDVNKENLEAFAPATAQKNINLKVLNEMKLPFPPLEEQTEIVRRVETLFAHADSIEQQAKAGLERVNQLTQSILAKAFRGELTAQWRKENPELISGENSAEALLERIRGERATLSGQKKIKPKLSKKQEQHEV